MPVFECGNHKTGFASEVIVQRAEGNTCFRDNAIYPYTGKSFSVEDPVCRGGYGGTFTHPVSIERSF